MNALQSSSLSLQSCDWLPRTRLGFLFVIFFRRLEFRSRQAACRGRQWSREVGKQQGYELKLTKIQWVLRAKIGLSERGCPSKRSTIPYTCIVDRQPSTYPRSPKITPDPAQRSPTPLPTPHAQELVPGRHSPPPLPCPLHPPSVLLNTPIEHLPNLPSSTAPSQTPTPAPAPSYTHLVLTTSAWLPQA